MLLISCPHCGPRPEGEFLNLGEAVQQRPRDPSALSEAEWSAYVSSRANIRGLHQERWWHMRSCGEIIVIRRDTVTHAMPFDAASGAP
jgi:heterotetrameric sarcosine oxidase delta subunit